jgi:large subunit ribosomal protein L18
MNEQKLKQLRARRRHRHVRKKVSGTPGKPRLSVFRSHRHLFCQLIDDISGRTIAAVSTLSPGVREKVNYGGNVAAATALGAAVAELAKQHGIAVAVMDRGGYKYHGRVKALAESARKAGLVI